MKTATLCLLIVVLILSGCTPLEVDPEIIGAPWQPAYLRALYTYGETNPEWDIVAASVKLEQGQVAVRVDVLDMQPETSLQAYLAIDDRPGGSATLPFDAQSTLEWDALISAAPPDGLARVVYPDGREDNAHQPWLEQNIEQDCLIFHLGGLQLDLNNLRFQAFITRRSSEHIEDFTSVFTFKGKPPAQAPLLLAFSDTLPASSPAQAMRRWNGAHTGPEGHRHGLYQLLKAAQNYNVPIALLDLKNPESLAGLDLVGDLKLVQELHKAGLLLLPDVAYGDPLADNISLEISRAAGAGYGLPSSDFVYGTVREAMAGQFQAIFSSQPVPGISQAHGKRLISLPLNNSSLPPATAQGPSLEIRKQLLDAALAGGSQITVLGGSVPQTVWADAVYAGPTFAYFAQHPWINPLDGKALLSEPPHETASILPDGCMDAVCSPSLPVDGAATREKLRAEIGAVSNATARELAWQMYLQRTQPTQDANRAKLEAISLAQIEPLLAAAEWAQKPSARSECSTDARGGRICFLASDQLFAALDSRGARLVFLATRKNGDFQEWTGTSAQFAVGLSDPSEWQLDAGAFADPRAIPGGFVDTPDEQKAYKPSTGPGQIQFTSDDGAGKTFQINGRSLTVTYTNFPSGSTQVLLAALPEIRKQADWAERYQLESRPGENSLTWGVLDRGSLRISSSSPVLTTTCFLDAGNWLRKPEDPDHAYPAGHILPIPLRVITFPSQGTFTIQLDILN